MSLLTSYGKTNRVVTAEKEVKFETAYWKYGQYETHRICTKSYKYVGMTYKTALACAKYVTDYYKRYSLYWSNYNHYTPYYRTMATATINNEGGNMYTVDVVVSEDDQCRHQGASFSEADYYSYVGTRQYDEGSGDTEVEQ